MWDLDLKNLVMNRADTMDTTMDTRNDIQFTGSLPSVFSHSGKMVVVKSYRSRNFEFLEIT